jgi:flagellar protein FliO/FliZ
MLELADLSRTVMGLGVVLVLLVVVFWLLRRFGPHGSTLSAAGGRRLALVESLALDPRTRLLLVRHDDREHLLVVSSTGTTTLVSGDARPATVASAGDRS